MLCDEFREGGCEEATSRDPETLGKGLGGGKQFVWKRDSRFHTEV